MTTIRRRFTTGLATAAALVAMSAPAALAVPDVDTIRDTSAFTCWDEGGPVPPNHCINTTSRGAMGLILVFPPDDRGPAEGITFDARFDDRPCPHDPGSPDGTWWQPTGPTGEPFPFYVCHHRP